MNRNDLSQPYAALHLHLDLGWMFLALLAVRLVYLVLLKWEAETAAGPPTGEKGVIILHFPLLQCFFAPAPWMGEWLCFPTLSVAYSFCFPGERGREGGGRASAPAPPRHFTPPMVTSFEAWVQECLMPTPLWLRAFPVYEEGSGKWAMLPACSLLILGFPVLPGLQLAPIFPRSLQGSPGSELASTNSPYNGATPTHHPQLLLALTITLY